MKVATVHSTSLVKGASKTIQMGVSAAGAMRMAKFFRDQIYTNKPWAVVREIMANALDEHDKHNVTRPIEITLPTEEEPNLKIRDFAAGLSSENIEKHFFQYMESTKDQSDEMIGGFGIGAKSPLAYSDLFFVTSWHDGEKAVYASVLSGENSQAHEMSREKSDEPSGIEVSVPINSRDFQTFNRYVASYMGMSGRKNIQVTPKIDPVHIDSNNILFASDKGGVYRSLPNWPVDGRVLVKNKDIVYSVNNTAAYGISSNFPVTILNIDEGIDLNPSRERVDGTARTIRTITKAYKEFEDEVKAEIQGKFDKCDNVKEMIKMSNESRFLNLSLTSKFPNWVTSRNKSSVLNKDEFSFSRKTAPGYSGSFTINPTVYCVIVSHKKLRYDEALAFQEKVNPVGGAIKILVVTETEPPKTHWKEGVDFFVYDESKVSKEDRAAIRKRYAKNKVSTSASRNAAAAIHLHTQNSYLDTCKPTVKRLQNILNQNSFKEVTIVIESFKRSESLSTSPLDSSQINELIRCRVVKSKHPVIFIEANQLQSAWIKKNYKTVSLKKFCDSIVIPQVEYYVRQNPDSFVPVDSIDSIVLRVCELHSLINRNAPRKIYNLVNLLLEETEIIDKSKLSFKNTEKIQKVAKRFSALNQMAQDILKLGFNSYSLRAAYPGLHSFREDVIKQLVR